MASKYSEVNQKKVDELQKQIKAKDTEIVQASKRRVFKEGESVKTLTDSNWSTIKGGRGAEPSGYIESNGFFNPSVTLTKKGADKLNEAEIKNKTERVNKVKKEREELVKQLNSIPAEVQSNKNVTTVKNNNTIISSDKLTTQETPFLSANTTTLITEQPSALITEQPSASISMKRPDTEEEKDTKALASIYSQTDNNADFQYSRDKTIEDNLLKIYNKLENYIDAHTNNPGKRAAKKAGMTVIDKNKFNMYTLCQIAAYMWFETHPSYDDKINDEIDFGINIPSLYDIDSTDPEIVQAWDNYCKYILTNPRRITSIRKTLSKAEQNRIKNTISPAANAFCNKGTLPVELQDLSDEELAQYTRAQLDNALNEGKELITNCFEAYQLGKTIANEEYLRQSTELIESAALQAITKMSTRVGKELENSIRRLTDISFVTNIPIDAMNMLTDGIMKPDDAVNYILSQLDMDIKGEFENQILKNIQKYGGDIVVKAHDLQENVTSKLDVFNTEMKEIMGYIEQGPDWVIDQIDTKEEEYERFLLDNIRNYTNQCIKERNNWIAIQTDKLYQNALIPANEAIIDEQKWLLDKAAQGIAIAEATAKMLVSRAILEIISFIGKV